MNYRVIVATCLLLCACDATQTELDVQSNTFDTADIPYVVIDVPSVPPDDTGITGPGCVTSLDCLGTTAFDICQQPICSAGNCTVTSAPNGTPCDDGDQCFASKQCQDGACKGGLELPCDDGNPCTADTCDSLIGCQHSNGSGACDDGNPCTLIDKCVNGQCQSGNSVCPCDSDAECAEWDDKAPCNGQLKCIGGACIIKPESKIICPPSQAGPCQAQGCDPVTGQCKLLNAPDGTPCNDNDLCTGPDSCLSGVCQGGPSCACIENQDCLLFDDGNLCNGVPTCQLGQCKPDPVTVKMCPEATGPCSAGGCDPKTGQCLQSPIADGTPCDDLNACTLSDSCVAGQCQGTLQVCNDGNPCTDDSCDANGNCIYPVNVAPCDDGNPCTTNDVCTSGVCVAGVDQCSCVQDSDCLSLQNDACFGQMKCINGQCTTQPGTGIQCNPNNNTDCAMEQCVNGQCILVPINDGAPCFAGDPCLAGATCINGICQASGPSTCACQSAGTLTCGTQKLWSNDAFGSTNNVASWGCYAGDFSGKEYAWQFVAPKAKSVTVEVSNKQANATLFLVEGKGAGGKDCSASACLDASPSKLNFLATTDKTYYVVVDGKDGGNGKFDLKVTCEDSVETSCVDGSDNDDDGLLDCNDPDCKNSPDCGSEKCTNGIDDDNDTLVDCGDPDCASLNVCASACISAAPAYCGLSTLWSTNGVGATNVVQSYPCTFQDMPGPEFVYSFKPTFGAMATVTLPNAFEGATLFVLQDQGGGCNTVNCIGGGSTTTSFYATPGVQYYIIVDGAAGKSGDYTIKMNCM